jgi:four helix bundle protein
MSTYRDLTIWRDSVVLIKNVYAIAEKFPKSEEFNLKQQLKRAVVSVALNIAEGKSRKTGKDFANFLSMANASLSEVEAVLIISGELGYIKFDGKLPDDIAILGRKIDSLRNIIK